MLHSRSRFITLLMTVAVVNGCSGADSTLEGAEEVVSESPDLDPAILAALPAGVTPEMVDEGAELFATCSVCHGREGEGTTLGPSLRDTIWVHISGSLPEIVQITRSGVPNPSNFPTPMPPMGGGNYDDTQLQSLAAYVHVLRISNR